METNQNVRTLDYDLNTLVANHHATIQSFDVYIKQRDLRFNGLEGVAGMQALSTSIVSVLQLMSQNARKKTARRMRRFKFRPTLQNANKLIAYLYKHAAQAVPGFNHKKAELRIGAKEQDIRDKRKAYVEAATKLRAARAEYQTVKGDFYKNLTK